MRHAIFVFVVLLAASPHALAQDGEVQLVLRPGRWTVTCGEGKRTCTRDAAAGDLTLRAWAGTGRASSFHVALDGESTVRVGTRSRSAVRTAGLVTLLGGLGVGAAMIGGGAAATTFCGAGGGYCNHGDWRWIALGIGVALFAASLGPPLMLVADDPVLDVASGTGRRRIAPDHPDVRLLADVGFAALLATGVVLGAFAGDHDPSHGAVLAVETVGLLATPALVTLAGYAGGGHGDFGWTALGAILGAVPAALIWLGPMLTDSDTAGATVGMLSTAIPMALVGSVLAYEVSNGDARRAIERGETPRGPSVMPSLAPLPGGGAQVGVVGLL